MKNWKGESIIKFMILLEAKMQTVNHILSRMASGKCLINLHQL